MRLSISGETRSPSAIITNPQITETKTAVCAALFALFSFPLPMYRAITTFVPTEIPTKKLTKRLITGPLLPTAASACFPVNFPTTATSAELKSCWSILLAASGSANIRILSHKEPESISVLCLFLPLNTLIFTYPFHKFFIKFTTLYHTPFMLKSQPKKHNLA